MNLNFKNHVFAVFTAKLPEADRAFAEVLAEHSMVADFRKSTGMLDLSCVRLGDPQIGGAHSKRAVMYSPVLCPESTVFVANLEDGWLTMVNCLGGKIAGVHVQIRTSAEDVEYPVQSLEFWKDGNSQRMVQVLRDTDKWEFFERGPAQAFENPTNYEKRKKRDRLTRSDLVGYMRSLGWDFSDEDFWRSEGPAVYYVEERE